MEKPAELILQPVISSQIKAVGYFGSNLYVQFIGKDEPLYVYKGVPESLHQELMVQESLGRFLNTNIKGVYEYERII